MRKARSPVLLLALVLILSVASASSSSSSSSVSGICDPDYEELTSTGECECREGFSGLGCHMCTSSDASTADTDVCSTTFGADYSCVTGFSYDANTTIKTYTCTLSSDLQALFPDGALDVSCDRGENGVATCAAAVYKTKETVNSEHVIDCNMTQCAFVTGESNGECANIDCKCGSECSSVTKMLVEGSLSGKPAKIKVTNSTELSIEIEGSPLPLSATCSASACEQTGTSGSSALINASEGDSSDDSSGLWIAIVGCAALAVAILLSGYACSGYMVAGRRNGKNEDVEIGVTNVMSRSAKLLEFCHVSCYADSKGKSFSEPARILYNVSGSASRGQVLGLLGPSGSGKTTLLNALAAVENGHSQFSGELLLNGKKRSKGYRRIAAYVQQDDSLYSTLTVRECILYSAQLRLSASMSDGEKNARVDQVIAELNLTHVANSRIGSVSGDTGRRGVSGGERKRVSIGMELVTSPQILILDEPTSGLDSSSAHSVVQLVKELAGRGRIVVLSIHQPSARSFLLLDQIMLLGKGKLLYSGAPADSKRYFQDLGFKCPENENIADFILSIASNVDNIATIRSQMKQNYTRPQRKGEAPPFTEEPTLKLENVSASPKELGTPGTPGTSHNPPSKPVVDTGITEIPSRSIFTEIRVLFGRTAQNILRHRSLLVLHVTLTLCLAIFGGLIFNDVSNDLAGFQNRMGAFYFILTFFGFASMGSMDLFISERHIFLRETGAMYYGAFSYFFAKATLDALLLRVLPALLFANIFYWIMGLQAVTERFLLFSVTLVLFNVAAGGFSLLIGVVSRRVGPANLGTIVVLLIMLLFGGFLLNSQSIPASVSWVKDLSIFSYAFEILMANELKGLIMTFDAPGYPAVPVYGEVYLKTLGMNYDDRYYDLAALAVVAVVLYALAFLFLFLQVPRHPEMAMVDHEKNDEVEDKQAGENYLAVTSTG